MAADTKIEADSRPSNRYTTARARGLGLKKNFGWALFGNIVYQASKWLILIIMTKLLGVADVGRFALALAICTPVTTLSGLNLRIVQVTDVRENYKFGQFLALQIAMSSLSVLSIIALALISRLDWSTAQIVIVLGLNQAAIVIRDVFLAFNQKYERMDTAAISKILVGTVTVVVMGVLMWISGSLLLGVLGMLIADLMVMLLWDIRATRRLIQSFTGIDSVDFMRPIFEARPMIRLVWLSLPLGAAGVMNSVSMNVPRYFIAGFLGEEALGLFAPIVALAIAGNLAIHAATISVLPRLSRYYLENQRAFAILLAKLVGSALLLGVMGLVISFVLGKQLLTTLLTSEYAAHVDVFRWSMLFALVSYVMMALFCGVSAMRQFWAQSIGNALALAVTTAVAAILIPRYGLVAGVWSLTAGSLVLAIIAMALIIVRLHRRSFSLHRAIHPVGELGG